jgi:hypothetical protein
VIVKKVILPEGNILFALVDQVLIYRALTSREVGFEVGWEKFESTFDGRAGHGDEIAKTFALVESENFAELVEDWRTALPRLNFFQQGRQRIRFHPARGALAAGLRGKEFRDL